MADEKLINNREELRRFKKMNAKEIEQAFRNVYEAGYRDGREEGSAGGALDMEKLRGEIGKIKGIGAGRLDEIMGVIEKVVQGVIKEEEGDSE